MDLPETFKAVVPSVVAFIRLLILSQDDTPPVAPGIFATGFVVDPDGIVVTNRHVVEVFDALPRHPTTGKPGFAAMLCHYGVTKEGKDYARWVPVEPKYWMVIESATPVSGKWHGDDEPDIGFVQLMLRELPALPLAHHEFYLRTGMPIATAGFPLGEGPLTIKKKIHQMEPFLRRGIVSSVYPFSIAYPHGFTIDILQQGGSSGSPIFPVDRAEVVGMMSSSMLDDKANTNISICVPADQIAGALQTFKAEFPPKLDDVRPLPEYLAAIPMKDTLIWEQFGPYLL